MVLGDKDLSRAVCPPVDSNRSSTRSASTRTRSVFSRIFHAPSPPLSPVSSPLLRTKRFRNLHPSPSSSPRIPRRCSRTSPSTVKVSQPAKTPREDIDDVVLQLVIGPDGQTSLMEDQNLHLVCNRGFPQNLRGIAWVSLLRSSLPLCRERKTLPYSSILRKQLPSDANIQIQKDLHRTFPGHPKLDSTEGKQSIFNVLKAVGIYFEDIGGYCQGMSHVAGVFLLVLDEEEAFWAMVKMIRKLELNKLWDHVSAKMEEVGVPITVFAAWFLTLFTYCGNFPLILRLWDNLLSKGFSFVYVVIIALLKTCRQQLLEMEFEDMMLFLSCNDKITSWSHQVDVDLFLEIKTIMSDVMTSAELLGSDFHLKFPSPSIMDEQSQ